MVDTQDKTVAVELTLEQWRGIALLVDRAGFLSDKEKREMLRALPLEALPNLRVIVNRS